MGVCPDDTTQPCIWYRYLCTFCYISEYDNEVYIRVMSNGLPDHCYGPNVDAIVSTLMINYTVKFNAIAPFGYK
jgi:hypothetical protein